MRAKRGILAGRRGKMGALIGKKYGTDRSQSNLCRSQMACVKSSEPFRCYNLLGTYLLTRSPSQIETMLTFSSPHPDKLTRTISRYLLSSTSNAHPPAYPHYACLIAAPTHFVTGREVTLIMDGEIYGEGAVGVAFLRPEQAKISEPRSRTEFLGVKILSRPMSVTRWV